MGDGEKLKGIAIFKNFTTAMLEEFSGQFSQAVYPAGTIVFRERSEGDTIFIIVSGEVVIEKKLDPEGRQFKPLAVLGKGEFFGEMAVLDGQSRSAQARVSKEAALYQINRLEFLKFIKDHPETGISVFMEIIKVVLRRLQHTSNELTMLFDISHLIMKEHKSSALFMEKMARETSAYFEGDWNIAAFVYNRYNEEYEAAGFKEGFSEAGPCEALASPKDGWLDGRTFIMTCSLGGRPLGYMRFSKSEDVTAYEKNNLGTIFNTISSITSSAIVNIEYRLESDMLLKLKAQKHTI